MDPLLLGLVVGVSTVVMLFSGIPIAFGLCFISVIFLVIAEGFSILNVFAETFYAGLNSFVLLSIPMFILMWCYTWTTSCRIIYVMGLYIFIFY